MTPEKRKDDFFMEFKKIRKSCNINFEDEIRNAQEGNGINTVIRVLPKHQVIEVWRKEGAVDYHGVSCENAYDRFSTDPSEISLTWDATANPERKWSPDLSGHFNYIEESAFIDEWYAIEDSTAFIAVSKDILTEKNLLWTINALFAKFIGTRVYFKKPSVSEIEQRIKDNHESILTAAY